MQRAQLTLFLPFGPVVVADLHVALTGALVSCMGRGRGCRTQES